ncbi:MAG: HAD family hydrolase [Rhodospirillales bacterium]|nr:HAD family hydrolase [Rhodospirillales bacterium]
MLIIFDCDGVLVDSEPIANRVLSGLLTELGLPVSPEDCRDQFVGLSIPSVRQQAERILGRALPHTFEDELWARDRAAFATELKPVAGIARVLESLPRPFCVASSGSLEKIRNSLTLTGLLKYFEPNLFSAAQVAHGKPAPDLFLYAAKRMKTPAADCVVIEDSRAGIQAARAAGMRVLGFAGAGHAGPGYAALLAGAGAAEVFENMTDLPRLLGKPRSGGGFSVPE